MVDLGNHPGAPVLLWLLEQVSMLLRCRSLIHQKNDKSCKALRKNSQRSFRRKEGPYYEMRQDRLCNIRYNMRPGDASKA